MQTNTSKSTLGKQLLGGAMGMAIAGAVYFVASTISTGSLGALLVDTPTISENANQVRVNDKTVTEAELRLIATRARQVAALQGEETEQALAQQEPELETVTVRTEARLAERMRRFNEDGTPVTQTAVTVNNVPTHGGAPRTATNVEASPATAATEPAVTSSSTLPNSGFGTNVLAVLALGASVVLMRKKIFGRA